MESCYFKVGCRAALTGSCSDCDGSQSIRNIARDPDEAQTLANHWEQRGCECPNELQQAVGFVRQSNTGNKNESSS